MKYLFAIFLIGLSISTLAQNTQTNWNGTWYVDSVFTFGQCCSPSSPIVITVANQSTGTAQMNMSFTLPTSGPCTTLGNTGQMAVTENVSPAGTFVDSTTGIAGTLNSQNTTMTWTFGNCYWYLLKSTSVLSCNIHLLLLFLIVFLIIYRE